MQHTTKTRVLLCPCGVRMQARDDEALRVMLRGHIERQHAYADAPHDELLDVMVSSAVYGLEYVPVRTMACRSKASSPNRTDLSPNGAQRAPVDEGSETSRWETALRFRVLQ
jgi:hypothetical protein